MYGEDDGATWGWCKRLLELRVEGNGVKPVPRHLHTENATNKLFTVFFTCLHWILQ